MGGRKNKRIRYIKQLDNYSCGPIAVVNIIKWATGRGNGKEMLETYKKETNCTVTSGTEICDLQKVLRREKNIVLKGTCDKVGLKHLDKTLKQNKAALLHYAHDRGTHFMLCVGKTNKYYSVVNCFSDDHIGNALRRISRNHMKSLLNYEKDLSIMWEIERKEK